MALVIIQAAKILFGGKVSFSASEKMDDLCCNLSESDVPGVKGIEHGEARAVGGERVVQ